MKGWPRVTDMVHGSAPQPLCQHFHRICPLLGKDVSEALWTADAAASGFPLGRLQVEGTSGSIDEGTVLMHK